MDLAHRLKAEREARRFTQAELAKRVSAKKRQSLISNLEAGTYPSSPFLPEIAYALGLHAMWLKTGIGPKYLDTSRDQERPASVGQDLPERQPVAPEVRDHVAPYYPQLVAEVIDLALKMSARGQAQLVERAEMLLARYPRDHQANRAA